MIPWAILSLLFVGGPSSSGPLDDAPRSSAGAYERCLPNPDRYECRAFEARRPRTPVHHAPDVRSEVAWELGWGEAFVVDWAVTRRGPRGWLFTQPEDRVHPPPNRAGWVEAKHLAGVEDYRRVEGCWPVAFVSDELGDWATEITMEADGRASAEESPAFVWFTENLVRIGSTADSPFHEPAILFGYEPRTHRLYRPEARVFLDASPDRKIRYRSPKELQGCDRGLKLGSRFRRDPPPTR